MKRIRRLGALAAAAVLAAGCQSDQASTPPVPASEQSAQAPAGLEPVTASSLRLAPVVAGGGTDASATESLALAPVTAEGRLELQPVTRESLKAQPLPPSGNR
jgi:PBP1b-binding outer membrane lipoprotein LpoB